MSLAPASISKYRECSSSYVNVNSVIKYAIKI